MFHCTPIELPAAASSFTLETVLSGLHYYRCHNYIELVALVNILPEILSHNSKVFIVLCLLQCESNHLSLCCGHSLGLLTVYLSINLSQFEMSGSNVVALHCIAQSNNDNNDCYRTILKFFPMISIPQSIPQLVGL